MPTPDEIHHDPVDKSVKRAQLIGGDGCDYVAHEEFNELIDAHSQALTDKDLAELTKSAEEETEDLEDPSQEEEDEGLTIERLAELMRAAKELQEKHISWDPYMVRSLLFSNAIDSSMLTCKAIFFTMKKHQSHLLINMFLTKVKKNNQATSKENTTLPPEVSEEEELPELLESSS